jgi:hypothetical protein
MATMRRSLRCVALAVVSLGLVSGPPAAGSCAGPQLSVTGASFRPLPPEETDPTAEPWYDVQRGTPLTVTASNLGPCQDFSGGAGGCGGPPPPPSPSPVVLEDVTLRVRQGSRSWVLATRDRATAPGPVDFRVVVPPALRPGPATLELAPTGMDLPASVRLVVS